MKIIKSTLAPFLDAFLPVGGILLNAAGNLPPEMKSRHLLYLQV